MVVQIFQGLTGKKKSDESHWPQRGAGAKWQLQEPAFSQPGHPFLASWGGVVWDGQGPTICAPGVWGAEFPYRQMHPAPHAAFFPVSPNSLPQLPRSRGLAKEHMKADLLTSKEPLPPKVFTQSKEFVHLYICRRLEGAEEDFPPSPPHRPVLQRVTREVALAGRSRPLSPSAHHRGQAGRLEPQRGLCPWCCWVKSPLGFHFSPSPTLH